MPRVSQLVFFSSFFGTFFVLYQVTSYISRVLKSHGWDINDIILLGLEKKDLTQEPIPKMLSTKDILTTLKADGATQAAAAAGLITALLILVSFSKIFKSSMLYLVIAARISH